jgi:hypothetical protein
VMELDAIIEKKIVKKSEAGRVNPRSIKYWNKTVSAALSYGLLSPVAEHHWIISSDCRRHSSTSVLRSASEHLLVLHPSQAVTVGLESFPFDLVAPFLLAILFVTSRFTRMRLRVEDWGDGATL